jgi:hypothetical protein
VLTVLSAAGALGVGPGHERGEPEAAQAGRRRHPSAGSAAARPDDRVQLAQVPSAVKALERDLGAALSDAGQVLLPEARKRREPGSVQRADRCRGRVVTGPGAIARAR